MSKRLETFLLSLFVPGLGYLNNGNKKAFYKTILFFYGTIILGIMFRLFASFWSFVSIIIMLTAIYICAGIGAMFTIKKEINSKTRRDAFLKFVFTILFFLITGVSFANRRALMGFDIMSMTVPAMQPTVLQNDKFLIDTWAYKKILPQRGDIVVHAFTEQQNLYLNRIIGVAYDKIEIKKGNVFINGQILNEPYVLSANITRLQSREMKALIIPQGHYFVMGDNRDASFGDSRFSGTITLDNIIGKITDVIGSKYQSRIGTTLK